MMRMKRDQAAITDKYSWKLQRETEVSADRLPLSSQVIWVL